jgi:hypothetical protein
LEDPYTQLLPLPFSTKPSYTLAGFKCYSLDISSKLAQLKKKEEFTGIFCEVLDGEAEIEFLKNE